MDPSRLRRVDELCQAALQLEPDRRTVFLDESCAGDAELRREVEAVLACEATIGGFLEAPAWDLLLNPTARNIEDQTPSLVGQQVGPYHVFKVVASGGMGTVYQAHDRRLQRDVALKFLPPASARDPQALERFKREARAVSALNHPNICVLHDIGDHHGRPFLVLELVEGQSLKDLLSIGPLSTGRVVELASQAADALEAAHSKGIIHRDIKPANILVTSRGQVKVLDFGLAKLRYKTPETVTATAACDESAQAVADLTLTGTLMGTIPYMSPEQASGRETDLRSDVFSFGAVLYEMATGKRAFERASATATLQAVISEQPVAPRALVDDLPRELENVISRCLRKHPDERYQSMADLYRDLQRLRYQPVRPAATRPARLKIVAAVAAAVTVAVGGWVGYQQFAQAPAYASVAVLPFSNAGSDPETVHLSDGITESLINRLSRLDGLKVLARSSILRYKGRDPDARSLRSELGVQIVLTGRLVQRGGELTVAAELVDSRDNTQLWGDSYRRTPAELASVEETISREVIARLRPKLSADQIRWLSRRHTNRSEAHDHYLRGRYAWDQRTEVALNQSVRHYEEAIRYDPSFALAWAGLADSYAMLAAYGALPRQEIYPKAQAAANRALELDPALPSARACLARIKTEFEWDWAGAEREYREALRSDPNYGTGLWWFAIHLAAVGRADEAIRHATRAHQIEPLSPTLGIAPGWACYFARDYARAEDELLKAAQLYPNFAWAHSGVGSVYLQTGRYKEAVAELERGLALSGRGVLELSYVAHAHALTGDRAKANAIVDELLNLGNSRFVPPEYIALIYTGMDERGRALEWFQKAQAQRSMHAWLLADPRLDPLRRDNAFRELMRRMRLL